MTEAIRTQTGGPTPQERNWAGNLTFSGPVVRPASIEEVQEIVARADRVGFLGTRHSFNAIADSDLLLDMRGLPARIDVDPAGGSVTVSAGTTYGTLGPVLQAHGVALANLASLPHISVAGSIATASHGSGFGIGCLASAVSALEIVRSDGELVRVARGDPDFAGCVVSLGALGAVVSVSLDVVPTYDVRQSVTEHIPWAAVIDDLAAVMTAGYSVSLFTRWNGEVMQAWIKERLGDDPPERLAGLSAGTAATRELHPLGDLDPVNCTPQLGRPGPWFDRLPHFRLGFTPSNGDELQSEYLVDWGRAAAAIEAVAQLPPATWSALLVSEIRLVARDELWMSPAFSRDSLAIHFTWRQEPRLVEAALGAIEASLRPLGARPHWGKVFLAQIDELAAEYPKLREFVGLAERFDDRRAFRNAWLDRHVFGPEARSQH